MGAEGGNLGRPSRRGQLRSMSEADLEMVRGWRNHGEVRRWMYTSHEIGGVEHSEWFAANAANPSRFALVYELDEVPTGFVNLALDPVEPGSATWGFYLAPDAPLGAGRDLGRAALEFAFLVAGVDCLRGEALATNVNSIAFHRRLGFDDKGVIAGHHRREDGTGHDVAFFEMTKETWRTQRESNRR
jgi:UDP-4-amino-4,6-dideoxy-N-acetyl-beta-L-altrosamine N-acetyltransferase